MTSPQGGLGLGLVHDGPLDRVVAAAGAAVASALITNPMDVVKTRVQAQAAQTTCLASGCSLNGLGASANFDRIVCRTGRTRSECGVFRGTLDAARKIVRREGMRVLWRGTPAALAMAIPQVGIYMPTYEYLKAKLAASDSENGGSSESVLPALLAGTTARGLAVLITSPLERYRTRAQAFASKPSATTTTWTCAGPVGASSSSASSLSSLSHLWKGTMATVARDVPFSGIYCVVTEQGRETLRTTLGLAKEGAASLGQGQGTEHGVLREVAYVNLLSGTLGGIIAASLTTPLDVVKTRIQVDLPSGGAKSYFLRRERGLRQVGGVMYRIATQEGPSRLFDGMVARAARAAPSCAIVLTSYEMLKAIIAKF